MKIVASLTLMTCVTLMACGPDDGPIVAQAPTQSTQDSPQTGSVTLTRDALSRINDYRAQADAAFLKASPTLASVARAHATDLFTTGSFSHTGPDGSSVGDRARRAGYGFCYIAENIAQGPQTIEEVLSGWMFSPGHRRNMLNPQAEDVGLARRGGLWVMVLGRSGC
ncbi:CAP domain-containing protein [Roseovarius sp. E0-M6]|uniref:CAP domain-containing protein n=1 Tax=Roseovarius sp. E0-M6 TaxID=3127118 RepID=UPI003010143E